MDYIAACNFLKINPKHNYSPQEIKSIKRKGLLIYHPDKNKNNTEEYYSFLEAIEAIEQHGCDDHGNLGDSTIVDINKIFTFFAKKITRANVIIINYAITTFDLFAQPKKIYHQRIKECELEFSFTANALIAKKKVGKYIIIINAIIQDPPDANFNYNPETKILYAKINKKIINLPREEIFIILPDHGVYHATNRINDNNILRYSFSHHRTYNEINIIGGE